MAKKLKVLLIGGSGIVGTSLARNLSSGKVELTVVSRHKPVIKTTFIKHSASEPLDRLSKKLKGTFDAIVINSGYIKETTSLSGQLNNFEVNLKYVLEILDLAIKKKVKKIIYTSTLAFLQKPFVRTITEEHPVSVNNLYGAAKFLAESLIVSFCQTHKIKYYSFRLPSPINTSNIDLHHNVIRVWVNNATAGKDIVVHGKGHRHQNFINADDISNIYLQTINDKKKSGIYNLASPSSTSMKDLAGMISKKYGAKIKYDPSQKEDVSYKNISIKKLSSEFDTRPFRSSKNVINELLKTLK